MSGYALDVGEPAPWVTVEHGPALFAVRCGRCKAWDAAYHVLIAKDRGIVRRFVETHNRCMEAA
jgi:hypothetical protein